VDSAHKPSEFLSLPRESYERVYVSGDLGV